jgi:FKBP-type peptidyl-prolyl cis-trans isomerase
MSKNFARAFGVAVGLVACGAIAIQPPKPAVPTITAPQPKVEKIVKHEGPDGSLHEVLKTSEIKLIIEDLKIGEGDEAKPSSTITIHYHGTSLTSGKVVDSTRGKAPAQFRLTSLIQGWQMGIPGMKVGGIRRLTIPWQLAYGERGAGSDIPPKTDLVFAIELTGLR